MSVTVADFGTLYRAFSIFHKVTSSGSGKEWQISYDSAAGTIAVGAGRIMVNGKYFSTADLISKQHSDPNTDQVLFLNAIENFVYLRIWNPLSLPTETDASLKIKIDIEIDRKAPNDKNENQPLMEFIPLAYVEKDGLVTDLRISYIVNNFSFLASSF